MYHKKSRLLYGIFCITQTIIAITQPTTHIPQQKTFEFALFGYSVPTDIKEVIDNFILANLTSHTKIKKTYAVVLYGPPGNGKAILAKRLAKTTNSTFIHFKTKNFIKNQTLWGLDYTELFYINDVGHLYEPGVTENNIKHTIELSEKSVVMCIDQLDLLFSKDYSHKHKDAQNTLKALLNNNRSESNLLIIYIVESLDTLEPIFANNFLKTAQRIYIGNPDIDQRKKIIKNCFRQYSLPIFNKDSLYILRQYMLETLDTSLYDTLNQYINDTEYALYSFDRKVRPYREPDNSYILFDDIQDHLLQLLESQEILFSDFQTEYRKQRPLLNSNLIINLNKILKLTKTYCISIENYCYNFLNCIEHTLSCTVPQNIIESLAEETEGMSILALTRLANDIYENIKNYTGKKIIWQTIIQEKLQSAKRQQSETDSKEDLYWCNYGIR